jgi:hypothetical protein
MLEKFGQASHSLRHEPTHARKDRQLHAPLTSKACCLVGYLPQRLPACWVLGLYDGDLDVDAGLDGDGGDVLDGVVGRHQVDQPLVDPHLEAVPAVRTLTCNTT